MTLSDGKEHCHMTDASLRQEGKAAHASMTVFLTYHDSKVIA